MGDRSGLNSQWTVLHWTSKVSTDEWAPSCGPTSNIKPDSMVGDRRQLSCEPSSQKKHRGLFLLVSKRQRSGSGSLRAAGRDAAAADSPSLHTALSDSVLTRLPTLLHHFMTFHKPNNSILLQNNRRHDRRHQNRARLHPFSFFYNLIIQAHLSQNCPAARRPFQICSALQPRQDPMTS